MSAIAGTHIVVGITGGIAAYKSVDLTRRLRDQGADVRVVVTPAGKAFITPLTLQATSGNPVHDSLLDTSAEAGMGHIELARWADQIVVAPASADFIARLATGLADTLLSTLCLASEAPITIAPAMNHVMWEKTATQRNVESLRTWGVTVLDPRIGPQACGEVGPGRMQEPEEIVQYLAQSRSPGSLDGVQVMVTAGPTWEALDPVRALTNHSSGKMGYAVATAARIAGASVTLISGPTALAPPAGIQVKSVVSAQEMLAAVESNIDSTDILICAAAVADYRPADSMPQKMKKDAPEMTIKLVRNPDILASMAARPSPPFIVGFAAETERTIDNARGKLERKKADLMVANPIKGKDKPFGSDRNALVLVDRNTELDLGQDTKIKLAVNLIDEIAKRFHAKDSAEST